MTDREGGKKMNRLDLIIDALEKANDGWQCFDEYEKALAAARELRELVEALLAIREYRFMPSADNQVDAENKFKEALRLLGESNE